MYNVNKYVQHIMVLRRNMITYYLQKQKMTYKEISISLITEQYDKKILVNKSSSFQSERINRERIAR